MVAAAPFQEPCSLEASSWGSSAPKEKKGVYRRSLSLSQLSLSGFRAYIITCTYQQTDMSAWRDELLSPFCIHSDFSTLILISPESRHNRITGLPLAARNTEKGRRQIKNLLWLVMRTVSVYSKLINLPKRLDMLNSIGYLVVQWNSIHRNSWIILFLLLYFVCICRVIIISRFFKLIFFLVLRVSFLFVLVFFTILKSRPM